MYVASHLQSAGDMIVIFYECSLLSFLKEKKKYPFQIAVLVGQHVSVTTFEVFHQMTDFQQT